MVEKWNLLSDWQDTYKSVEDAKVSVGHIKGILDEHNISLENEKVLEIGTGKGLMLKAMRSAGVDVVGVDRNPRGDQIEGTAKARVEALPFEDATFGVVISLSVFDTEVYEQDQQKMLGEIVRVLKPNGVLLTAGADHFSAAVNPNSVGLTLISDAADIHFDAVYRKSS